MHITVSRCGVCFWMVSHVQQSASSVRRMSKCMFEEVSKVSNTAPNLTSMFVNNALLGGGVRAKVCIREQRKIKRRSKALLNGKLALSIILIDLAADFTALWLHLGSLSLLLSSHFCPNSFCLALVTIFCHFALQH